MFEIVMNLVWGGTVILVLLGTLGCSNFQASISWTDPSIVTEQHHKTNSKTERE